MSQGIRGSRVRKRVGAREERPERKQDPEQGAPQWFILQTAGSLGEPGLVAAESYVGCCVGQVPRAQTEAG